MDCSLAGTVSSGYLGGDTDAVLRSLNAIIQVTRGPGVFFSGRGTWQIDVACVYLCAHRGLLPPTLCSSVSLAHTSFDRIVDWMENQVPALPRAGQCGLKMWCGYGHTHSGGQESVLV